MLTKAVLPENEDMRIPDGLDLGSNSLVGWLHLPVIYGIIDINKLS